MNSRNEKAAEAAGRLYRVFKDTESDPVEKVFKILSFIGDAPLDKTLEIYRQLKSKWLTLAEITTAKELSHERKEEIEKYIKQALGDRLCFLYDIDPGIIGGVTVRVGDNVFDESVISKIRDISLKGTKTV